MRKLANQIHEAAYKRYKDSRVTIFLCGAGDNDEGSIRQQIAEYLPELIWYRYAYQIVFAEEIFENLLLGHSRQDLISLESILAESVDVILIALESYGAVAELGVFSSHKELRKKIVCVVNREFKKDKSFINYGPLRLMKDTKEGKVVFADFDDIASEMANIRKAIKQVAQKSEKPSGVSNIVDAYLYVLSCVYLLEPIIMDDLIDLVMHASNKEKKVAEALTRTAISVLTRRKDITISPNGIELTPSGLETFHELGTSGTKGYTFDLESMDSIRMRILNWQLRDKPLHSR
ncbi:MAG: hypothetical protein HND51_21025 [Chloroflexi bacterium]|nr:hypothetical protein [Chloroflexota bacterium]